MHYLITKKEKKICFLVEQGVSPPPSLKEPLHSYAIVKSDD